ncbi:MAG: hypothetical protein ACRDYX_06610 [Egibacteraceae bacterium]
MTDADEPQPEVDVNALAIEGAGLAPDVADWLREVNDQVEPRLARVKPDWRQSPQPDAARACAFGLLLGYLADLYPHMRRDLHGVAEAHSSFTTLPAGNRLTTLQQLAAEPRRAADWIGSPLGVVWSGSPLDVNDPERILQLFD